MADASQIKELTARLEQGVKDIFASDKYAEYLETMSKFHKYSTRNTLLIHSQMAEASYVAGYAAWKTKFGRQVVKGAKSIKIFAPAAFTKSEEREVIDPVTRRPVIGEDGLPLMESVEKQVARFRVTSVFDVSHTVGKPLPALVHDITGNVEQYEAFMEAIKAVSPLPIVFEPLPDDTDGLCRMGEKIVIREGMSQVQTVCAAVHELAHAVYHDRESVRITGDEKAVPKTRRTEELEAESAAYVTLKHFDIDTSENSFNYAAEWSRDFDIKVLNDSLDTIRKMAAELIDAIDGKFQQIVKERGITIGDSVREDGSSEPEAQAPAVPGDSKDAGNVYAAYCNKISEAAAFDEAYANAAMNADEQNARTECEAAVKRVVMGLFTESMTEHKELYRQYTGNPGFKARLEDYVFSKTYLEPKTAERNAPLKPEETVPLPDISPLLAKYERNAAVSSPQRAGTGVLMTPLFIDGNFNRENKKIRVTAEEPIGKYRIYSHDEGGDKYLYILAASGHIDRLSTYFRMVWDGKQHKSVDYRPSEAEIDAIFVKAAVIFESSLANPKEWAMYQYAAVLDRIGECEAHNAPVRELREEASRLEREEAERERQEEQRQKREKFDARVNEIAEAIEKSETIRVDYDENEHDGKNPVLGLFKLYGVELPLRTQGWVNTGLAEINGGGYKYFNGKHKGDSTAFNGYLRKLRDAIKDTPIERKRENGRQTPAEPAEKETGSMERKLFERFTELFPGFMNGEYNSMELKSEHAKPLNLEWIFGDTVSIAHTYELDGKPAFEPYVMLNVNSADKTMTASAIDISEPPRHDVVFSEHGRADLTMQRNINTLTLGWLDRIEKQGFVPVRGTFDINGVNLPFAFGSNGEPIMPEPDKPEKQYSLGYGFFGDGITVWNQAEQKDGGYAAVAHIAPDRNVAFYDGDMPHGIKEQIDAVAKSPDTRAFGFTTAPENAPPSIDGSAAPASVYEAVKRVLPETAAPNASMPDLWLPDPQTSIQDRNDYGYTDEAMLPLSNAKAAELFNSGHCVYLLYPDNTEGMAFDREEILNFDGLCGIEQEEWMRSPERAAMMALAARAEDSLESELLHGGGNRFGIYQVRNDIDGARDFRFAPLRELETLGLAANRANYELVYAAPFPERVEFLSDRYPVLNRIYKDFNGNQPADYTGRSVSVSDVIVLKHNGDISSFYVDSAEFKELDAFIGDETQWADAIKREQERGVTSPTAPKAEAGDEATLSQVGTRPEVYTGKTVAELESDAKAGKVISLTDLANAAKAENGKGTATKAKPSLMARLEQAKNKAAAQGGQKPAPERGNDKEERT
ncbi:MAG: ssDNA-binding domain-containing protein [Clostridiales bacterium]|nr:ssDNA-binding domain-containing protein [Clostridiales bacterium]